MSLIDELRAIEHYPSSHEPTAGEVLAIVGKLIGYVEHGVELFAAAEQDAKAREAGEPATGIDELLSPPPEQPEAPASPAASSPSAAGAGGQDTAALEAEIASLKQQLATAQAQEQRTEASVEPIAGEPRSSGENPEGSAA